MKISFLPTRVMYTLQVSFCILLIVTSCKRKPLNYITYYNRVNEIDSIYRFERDTLEAITQYKKLFEEYPPKNQERIKEFETYIMLSDQYHKDFGGKKTLYKLVPLIAPYEGDYKDYLPIFKKYGIDSVEVKKEIADWKKNLNKRLIDSFSIAMIRDQEKRHVDTAVQAKNVRKNAELLLWTFKNYGFPSVQKIGTMPMHSLLTHMNESKKYYPTFKTKLIEYVKSGDCPPLSYAMMFDSYHVNVEKGNTIYGYNGFNSVMDSVQVNRNRKSIGLPSLKHSARIRKDLMAKLKKEH
ncbi:MULTISPECIES: hypothetical protein [Chryseobacterium]|uniref:Uncharacterized protein n=1 Tax=Chryseobacterium camelliae TaxID=1265445 RepID=A0ABU0THD0_9FLAO|nr:MULTISPECIES: hypothetical protein [Chryseobacterium]MDT3405732.1 hypothetical protein [Pseudacidovorax intermedius]MDQ1096460.1 hypothetical protein [Chryseobacterium camelliae]MDQ1100400.1 hypothetical protein [Chryseobacterium sp. SORGH_AS_1048]MDR6087741.1 hypothetical protein [Chryseobacterium sp. SORGH_AS_0909]MDR6132117.1 hypothetical protein [Chryseobacterium sp. SORGH_AS_1175]